MKKSVSFKITMVILIYVLFLISSIGIELLPIKETSILIVFFSLVVAVS